MRKFLGITGVLAVAVAGIDASAAIVINEIDYDQVGTDTAEFIELYNNGPTSVDISNYVVALINGSNDQFYNPITTIPAGTTLAAGAYYVIGSTNVVGANQNFPGTTDQVQNGAPDAVGLYSALGSIASGAASTTNSAALVDGVVYEGPDTLANYPGFTQAAAGLFDSNASNLSFGRLPNGTGDFAVLDFPTPGAVNAIPEPATAGVVGLIGCAGLLRRRARA